MLFFQYIAFLHSCVQLFIQFFRSRYNKPSVSDHRKLPSIAADYRDVAQLRIRDRDIGMTAKVSLGYIFLAQQGDFVIPGNDLFSIRIVYRRILAPALAGISYRKMRSGLLRDQDRELIHNIVFLCHCICRGIGSDRELAHWKGIVIL